MPRKDKEYCTYWIFNGECAFTHSPRGCKYKHEMPRDPKTMAEVGLKALPKWWTDRNKTTLKSNPWRHQASNAQRAGSNCAQQFGITVESMSAPKGVDDHAQAITGPLTRMTDQVTLRDSLGPLRATPQTPRTTSLTSRFSPMTSVPTTTASNGASNLSGRLPQSSLAAQPTTATTTTTTTEASNEQSSAQTNSAATRPSEQAILDTASLYKHWLDGEQNSTSRMSLTSFAPPQRPETPQVSRSSHDRNQSLNGFWDITTGQLYSKPIRYFPTTSSFAGAVGDIGKQDRRGFGNLIDLETGEA